MGLKAAAREDIVGLIFLRTAICYCVHLFQHLLGLMVKGVGLRQQQLLKLLLQNKNGLGIDDLAAALEISRTAVQQHIASLEREGYIRHDSFGKTAGRPVRIYVLTEEGINLFPKQYSWFSEILLEDVREHEGAEGLKKFMRRLGVRTGKSLLAQVDGKSKEERVEFLIAAMREMGYEAQATRLEGGGEQIAADNCVYHNVAMKYEEVCEFDRALITTVLDNEVEAVECMASGGNCCLFRLLGKDEK